MKYGCVYSFVGRRGTTAETTAASLKTIPNQTAPHPLIHVLKLVLHTHVEVRFSMTCRFLDERKRGNVHIPAMMSVAFPDVVAVSYTHLRAHETSLHLVCRLLLEKKK